MDEELGHESMLWNDDSWAFPILVNQENGGKNGNSETAKEVEAPPPATAAKGKKRAAAGGGGRKSGGRRGGDKKGKEEKGGGGGESDDHELHIWTERERRKRMRDMFANLHALVPHLPARADKSTIVDEAVLYIRKLQLTLTQLHKLKEEKLNNTINPTNNPSIIPQNKLVILSREAFLAEQGSTSSKNVNSSAITLSNPNKTQNTLLFSGPEFPAIFKTWTSPNVVLNVCGPDAHINVCGRKKPGLLTAICCVMEKYKLEVVSAQVSSGRGRRMYMIHAHVSTIFLLY
ncbi:hypothetical protein BUALT_Bualt19G0108800 [Buddleja alternifolia]|uniref:BHLH domain-containing protein n=1 Tax=Buddleja alternifolia TaxID=168488 RepID=A0AAV6W779_9LAMI|nr:hypothetical protein BUALT_Bualt19G0108800 [Buddleja alternifolia]